MNKIIIGVALVASLCGCTRNNFVDGCLFGEKLGDDLDWRRCALFVGDTGVAGLGVDESMVIIKRPLRPFDMSAQVEQYIACTNSNGAIKALLYIATHGDLAHSPEFVKQVEELTESFKTLNGRHSAETSKGRGSEEVSLSVFDGEYVVSLGINKNLTFDSMPHSMTLMVLMVYLEDMANDAAKKLALDAKDFQRYWTKSKQHYPVDYVKLVESKAAALSRKK